MKILTKVLRWCAVLLTIMATACFIWNILFKTMASGPILKAAVAAVLCWGAYILCLLFGSKKDLKISSEKKYYVCVFVLAFIACFAACLTVIMLFTKKGIWIFALSNIWIVLVLALAALAFVIYHNREEYGGFAMFSSSDDYDDDEEEEEPRPVAPKKVVVVPKTAVSSNNLTKEELDDIMDELNGLFDTSGEQ